jgi:hypothetical protein
MHTAGALSIPSTHTSTMPQTIFRVGERVVTRDGFYAKIVSLEDRPAQLSDTFDQILVLDVASVGRREGVYASFVTPSRDRTVLGKSPHTTPLALQQKNKLHAHARAIGHGDDAGQSEQPAEAAFGAHDNELLKSQLHENEVKIQHCQDAAARKAAQSDGDSKHGDTQKDADNDLSSISGASTSDSEAPIVGYRSPTRLPSLFHCYSGAINTPVTQRERRAKTMERWKSKGLRKAWQGWEAYLEEVWQEQGQKAQELAKQQLEEAAREKQSMAEAEAERRIEMCKRVVHQMLRHQLLMAWSMFVATVRETQHNRETVRKVLSRLQHRQLAQAFDCYAGAVDWLVVQREKERGQELAKQQLVAQGKLQRELADTAKRLGAAKQALEGKGSEAAAAHREVTQLQSALAAEKSAKDAASTKSEELEKSLNAEKATRAAADGRVAALEKDVAAVQSELEEARRAAADTCANLSGQSAQLSEALEKAKAEARTLTQQRDTLSDEVEALKEAVATVTAEREWEREKAASDAEERQQEAERRRQELEEQLRTAKAQEAAKKQVQSLEANVQELAIKSRQLEGALKTEQEAHRDTDKAYKDAEKKGTALQKNVAALQQELDDAKKVAEDTRTSLGGEASQLSDSLDKARAELRELALDRDALSEKAKGLTEKKVQILQSHCQSILTM